MLVGTNTWGRPPSRVLPLEGPAVQKYHPLLSCLSLCVLASTDDLTGVQLKVVPTEKSVDACNAVAPCPSLNAKPSEHGLHERWLCHLCSGGCCSQRGCCLLCACRAVVSLYKVCQRNSLGIVKVPKFTIKAVVPAAMLIKHCSCPRDDTVQAMLPCRKYSMSAH